MSYFYYPEQFGNDHCRQLSQKKIKRASAFNRLGAVFILRKDKGVGGPENGNFPLLYIVKMSLCWWVGCSKKPQNTLT